MRLKSRLQDWKRRFQFSVKAKCSSNRSLVEHSYISILLLESLCTCFTVTPDHGSQDKNEKMKEKKERKKRREKKKEIKLKRKYEKQAIGEQGDGEKLRKRREKMRGESFFSSGPKKGDHGKIKLKEESTRWKQKSDEKQMKEKRWKNKKRVKNTRRFFFE